MRLIKSVGSQREREFRTWLQRLQFQSDIVGRSIHSPRFLAGLLLDRFHVLRMLNTILGCDLMVNVCHIISSLSLCPFRLILRRSVFDCLCFLVVANGMCTLEALRKRVRYRDSSLSVQSSDQVSQLGFDETRPDGLRLLCFAGRSNTEIILVVVRKERVAGEEIIPIHLLHENLVHNITAPRELTKNDRLGRQRDVVGGTHGGISWCDDGH